MPDKTSSALVSVCISSREAARCTVFARRHQLDVGQPITFDREDSEVSVKGEHLSALAFPEKERRSHFWAPVSRVVAEEDGFSLNPEKYRVTSAVLYFFALKANASETTVSSSGLAVRACGGAAFSKHLGLEHVLLDSRAAKPSFFS